MPYRGKIGELVEISRIGAEELSVDWRIRDVLSLPVGCANWYESPQFRMDNETWRLVLWPNWKRTRNLASGWLMLDLSRCDEGPPKTFHSCIGIRGSGGLEKSREVKKEFSGSDPYDSNRLCSRSELMEHKTRLMPDGILNITCVLKRTGIARGCQKALEDFANLLASGENSDVTVQVGDVEFKVHRNILSVRSPALSVSLRHESKERASNRIVIEDCEPEVFREFLLFLYTGSVQLLSEQNVFSLYRIADKYLADDLKVLCLNHIRDTLCIHTFCDTIRLALVHRESDLLQRAIQFATENFPSIICSEEWQNFNCEYPWQVNEILVKCFGQHSETLVINRIQKWEICVLTLTCLMLKLVDFLHTFFY